ncbi:glycogen synthase GlgA [Algicella marina]|uniref:Glycogen synthase n=1 Tax=Algicella marina TaxID=2683284 RepID=A0A6P1SUQ6_9RHOB|nr:glycogen synthase GlgA [Algicella marina]QHQ34178.1 glycogen synthase GlgA [Algicella marina]
MRRVLSVVSECAPLVKTGGLADVAGALPAAMAVEGWHLRTLLPAYPAVLGKTGPGNLLHEWNDLFGYPATLRATSYNGLDLLLLEAPHFFDRPGNIYLDGHGLDWPDNPERFAALSFAAAEIAQGLLPDWRPELLHCHDWQAGLAPQYLAQAGSSCPSLMTVHNIAFHGLSPPEKIDALKLDGGDFNPGGYEFWGNISALKAGLTKATRLSTVSPTYAKELTTPEFGMGLDGVISARADVLSGILNGIDLDAWSPKADPAISPFSGLKSKAKNKVLLRERFGLPATDGPLCVVVSRLTEQKGLDLLLAALPALREGGGQLALLGSGDPSLEAAFIDAASADDVGVIIGYDEPLSHLMFAGGDVVLVPSRFEPCGLTQLYGLRYGAVPLVARTGGLADTVIDANAAALRAGVATGIVFSPVTAEALSGAFDRLHVLYRDSEAWAKMVRRAMQHSVGWDASARDYSELYARLVEDR